MEKYLRNKDCRSPNYYYEYNYFNSEIEMSLSEPVCSTGRFGTKIYIHKNGI